MRIPIALLVLGLAVGCSAPEERTLEVALERGLPQNPPVEAQTTAWTLQLAENREVGVDLRCDAGALALTLLAPDGQVRREWVYEVLLPGDGYCPQSPQQLWVADSAGTWRLEVSSLNPDQPTPYEIEWTVDQPASDVALAVAADRAERRAQEALAELEADSEAAEAQREALAVAVEQAGQAIERGYPRHPGHAADRLAALLYSTYGALPAEALFPLAQRGLSQREAALPDDHLCLSEALGNLATIEYDRGRHESSLGYEQRSYEIKQSQLDPADPDLLYTVREITKILVNGGRCNEAQPWVERLEHSASSLTDRPDELVDTHLILGEYHRCIDDFAEAEAQFEQAQQAHLLAHEQELADPSTGRDLRNSLATLRILVGEFAAAELLLRENLRELANEDSLLEEATARLNLGEVFRSQGRWRAANVELERAHQLAKQIYVDPAHPRLVFHRMDRARLLEQVGDFDQAEALYRMSLPHLTADAGAGFLHAENLTHLARLLRKRGQHSAALEQLRRGLELRERVFGAGHPAVGVTLVELAHAQLAASPQRLDEPKQTVDRGLAALGQSPAYPEARASGHALRAELSHRQGQHEQALRQLGRALELIEAQRPRTGGGQRSLAEAFGRHRRLYDRMVDWQLERGDVAAAWDHIERARARTLLDQMQAGGIELTEGVSDRSRRTELRERDRQARSKVAEYHKRLRDVWADAELSNAARQDKAAQLEARLDAAYDEVRDVHAQVRSASTHWRGLVDKGAGFLSLQALQRQHLSSGVVLVLYQVGEEASHLFLVPALPARPKVATLSVNPSAARLLGIASGALTRASLDRALFGDRSATVTAATRPGERGIGGLGVGPEGMVAVVTKRAGTFGATDLERLAALREVLMPDAIWQQVARASEAIVIPDHGLFRFPLEALVVQSGPDLNSTRFWLDDGPVLRYAASATFLANLVQPTARDQAPKLPDVLSVANPEFGSASNAEVSQAAGPFAALPALPGTALEARAIQAAFSNAVGPSGSSRVRALTGQQATERNVRDTLAGARYIHLATHGLVDGDRSDMFAALALTPEASGANRQGQPSTAAQQPTDTENDGLLQLFEIYDLELADTELVVLSACNSNVGPLVEGEGAFALSRGFFAAGADRVVASLWPVADQASAELIGEFFRGVAESERGDDGVPYAALLRRAKRAVRAQPEYAAPFYWAPFVISGAR